MRLLFILKAEETGLLPHGIIAYDRAYGVLHLLTRLENANRLSPDKLRNSCEAYSQLLATCRIVYAGSPDPDIHVAPFLGRLFDPNRYPLLEGRRHDGSWTPQDEPKPLPVRDSVTREILRSLKYARGAGGVVQWVSFGSLQVEQIGHMYEGLLDRALERAPTEEAIFLIRSSDKALNPRLLESELRQLQGEALIKRVADLTGKKKAAIATLLESDPANDTRPAFVAADPVLRALALPIRRLLQPNGVIRRGGLFVTAGESRRSQGAHYTPAALTAPIVQRTLGPIVYRNYNFALKAQQSIEQLRTPRELLEIKVCDLAMGSGAFLVQAVRFLAERLADAWDIASASQDGVLLTMPVGGPSSGATGERLLPATREERILAARRLVVERCIYGVDRNPLAVEMAKLSLWLETLSTGRPFTFLDHALRSGDALVGLTEEQIAEFHWKPDVQRSLGQDVIEERVKAANAIRREILADGERLNPLQKRDKLASADERLDLVRFIGDLTIAAFFAGDKDRQRQAIREEYLDRLIDYLRTMDPQLHPSEVVDALRSGQLPVTPFHWEIEFPEVFDRENPGFDAIVGNPPFLGGTRISTEHGMSYFQWLTNAFAPAGHLCDQVAYFFRQAYKLLRKNGTFGLIATNTIAQGDTREGGLRPILAQGSTIYSALTRLKWPGTAAVTVSVVHVHKGQLTESADLDGKVVNRINAYLVAGENDGPPMRLQGNPYFSAGSKIYGQGFLFDDSDPKANPLSLMRSLLNEDPGLKERILSYIGGDEINSNPSQSPHRFAISLSDVKEECDLAKYAKLADIVREKVKPERDLLGSNPNNTPLKRRWWAYQAHRPELYAKLRSMDRVLVVSLLTKHLSFIFLPTGMIYSHRVAVFCLDSFASFCALQSYVHEVWARFFSSTFEDRLNYAPADCFETFPFPQSFERNPVLEQAGREYYVFRAALMVRNNEGLTETYNRFHNPDECSADIIRLRDLHAAMDRSALDTYGWTDIQLSCEFLLDYEDEVEVAEVTGSKRKKPWRYRWPDEIRDKVLARLLKLNAERHAEEVASGIAQAEKAVVPSI